MKPTVPAKRASCLLPVFMERFVWIVVLLVSLGAESAVPSHKSLRLVAPEYPPYYGKALPENGFVSQIVGEVFERAGYQISVDFFPWKRAVEMVKLGEADGIYTIWYREDRTFWLLFSEPIYFDELVFMKKKTLSVDYHGMADLKPYIISDVFGYAYPDVYSKAPLRKKRALNDEESIKRLILGGADLAIIDRIQGIFLLDKLGAPIEAYDFLAPPVSVSASRLGISTLLGDGPDVVNRFNVALMELKASGRLAEIAKAAGFPQVRFK